MNLYSDELMHKAGQHPGWAVRFQDGSWQSGGHGWYREDDAALAERYETVEEANNNAKRCQESYNDTMPYEVVVAWEPLCESLRNNIHFLKKANKVSPDNIRNIIDEMENLLYTLKETQK